MRNGRKSNLQPANIGMVTAVGTSSRPFCTWKQFVKIQRRSSPGHAREEEDDDHDDDDDNGDDKRLNREV